VTRAWFALAIALAGCGRIGFDDRLDAQVVPVVPPPPSYQSGTRLRAQIHEVGNAKRFVSWFDTQLGEECYLAVAEDGVTRCIPSRMAVGVQFSDAGCTTPLIILAPPVDTTDCPSAAAIGRITVGDRTRAVQVSAQYTGTVYQGQPGNCVIPSSGVFEFYGVGATLAPEMFVGFHDELTASGDLAYIEHVGDDGSRLLEETELVVRATGERCTMHELGHDELVCLPQQASGSLVYADANCSEQAIVTNQAPTPRMHTFDQRTACTDSIQEVTTGAELTAYYYLNAQQTCTPLSVPTPYRAFRAVSIEPAIALASGRLEVPVGSPIVVASWRFAQGQSLPGQLYDTRHGDFCLVMSAATTYERVCAPMFSGYAPLYSDASCTAGINGVPRCRGSWRANWFPSAPAEFTCEGLTQHFYPYDQPIAGPFYQHVDGTCALADPTVVEPRAMSATQMSTSELARVTRRMD
jgi:hypothetical protein